MARPSDRDLIPKGLPYGQRQEWVESAQQAGMPLGTRGAAARTATPERPAPLTGGVPASGGFDALAMLQPTMGLADAASAPLPPASGPDLSVALASPNPVIRDIAARLLRTRQ